MSVFHHGEEISYFECSDNKYFGLARDAGALIISWWVVIALNFVIHSKFKFSWIKRCLLERVYFKTMRKLLKFLQFSMKCLVILNLRNQKVCKLLKFCRMPAQCIPFIVETAFKEIWCECMYSKHSEVSLHLNTMTAHYLHIV